MTRTTRPTRGKILQDRTNLGNEEQERGAAKRQVLTKLLDEMLCVLCGKL